MQLPVLPLPGWSYRLLSDVTFCDFNIIQAQGFIRSGHHYPAERHIYQHGFPNYELYSKHEQPEFYHRIISAPLKIFMNHGIPRLPDSDPIRRYGVG